MAFVTADPRIGGGCNPAAEALLREAASGKGPTSRRGGPFGPARYIKARAAR
jgi:hypothetical protein